MQHIVVDLDQEGLTFRVTLVIANKTSTGEELIEHLKAKAAQEPAICSSPSCRRPTAAVDAPREARARLADDARPPQCRGAPELGHDRRPRPLTATITRWSCSASTTS